MDATTFLAALYPEIPDGHVLSTHYLPAKHTRWHDSHEEVIAAANAHKESDNVYIRVSTIKKTAIPSGGQRGGADLSASIGGFWADVDYGKPDKGGGGKKYPPNQEAALGLIDGIGVKPTMVVHSGHGLQAWWCFVEPWVFESVADFNEAACGAKGWSEFLIRHAAARGWTLDSVYDLSRIMRLPGYLNRKAPPVVPVTILKYDPRYRYNQRDLIEQARDGSELEGVSVGLPGGASVKPDPKWRGDGDDPLLALTVDARPDDQARTDLFMVEPLCADSFYRRRKDHPSWSESEYDLSLANYAIRVGKWDDYQTGALIVQSRRERGDLKSMLPKGQFSTRKIRIAINIVRAGETPLEETRTEAVQKLVAPRGMEGMGRETRLATLSKALDIELVDLIQYTGSEPDYEIVTTQGQIAATIDDIIQQHRLRRAFAQTDRRMMKKFSKAEWEQISGQLLEAMVQMQREETSEADQLREAMSAHLYRNRGNIMHEDADAMPTDRHILALSDGCHAVPVQKFLAYIHAGLGMKLTIKQIGRARNQLGWTRRRYPFEAGRLWCYIVPKDDSISEESPI